MSNISIGEASRISGVNIETIRYYERSGVVSKPERSSNGRRVYKDNDVRQLRFVRQARDLGFSLETTQELLVLAAAKDISCSEARHIAERHRELVANKLNELNKIADALDGLISHCHSDGEAHCAVLDALLGESDDQP
ncbi:MAG: MerR family transcriptional regulator [Flavobacteriales bacterium]|nr:MerR family transcriptional regulator [Flavobacteriales bacterium]